ncbi:DUF1549 and DUF1553 domain-containing protein [Schlesneria paludicola]|uniref:DUF1549 and DUF1553 domain-containing protein n=1 Tax=Schlesneria paludicola TaxID=360056 RepID=UPI000A02BA24|nr:DUF1549 and DUF1553 domain-containing protein [Schlesneria paludicola]
MRHSPPLLASEIDGCRSRMMDAGWLCRVAMSIVAVSAVVLTVPQIVSADDVQDLADAIDRRISARWKSDKVTEAALADDAEYLRRVSLHLGGTIPTVSVARKFLADQSPLRRRRLVDNLLDSPQYITNFSNFWTRVMLPESATDFQALAQRPGFQAWLRQHLGNNTPYDALVYELLTTPLAGERGMTSVMQNPGSLSPIAFFTTKQIKPENLAAATSRMFMGIRIECAQCHNHPYDAWKQEQFWGYAAFFAGIERINRTDDSIGQVKEVFDRRELTIPDHETVVQATYLDGTQPQWRTKISSRRTLADWLTSKQNPYFAKSTANRIWGHLFGVGIVDPVDDFGANNRPSHPELLDELAASFTAHQFDVKFLIRGIVASKTYQRSSRKTDPSQSEPQQFARMAVQGLTGEQLFDSIAVAIGYLEPFESSQPFQFNQSTPKIEFLELFAPDNKSPTERQTSILQALALMNGQFTASATSLEQSATLTAITEFPRMTTAARIEALYLATLTRKPRPEELDRLIRFVDEGGPSKNQKQALADLFWALLNSSEFLFNH